MAKFLAFLFVFMAIFVLFVYSSDDESTPSPLSCPEGWVLQQDICRLTQQFQGTAQQAAAYCTSLNAFLSVYHGEANGSAYIECSKYAQ